MKLYIHPWKIIWRFLVTLLFVYVFIFLVSLPMFIDFSTGKFIPWDYRQPLEIGIILLLGIIALIPALKNAYYEVFNDSFTARKGTKVFEYSYSNIEYIDDDENKKHNKVAFYIKGAKMQYLLADKNNELINILHKKCKNTMSKERFYQTHPEER